jgi:hypothetical protein
MRDLRDSDLIRSLTQRPGIGISAVGLAFALAAGLACDENAPTETRTTAAAPVEAEAGGDPDLTAGDITALAIALPVNQSIATTAPAFAFRVNQTGTGPNGSFQITRSGSTQTALQGLTNGRGRAGFFRTTNTLNPGAALEAQSNGSGVAFQAIATGTGRAGSFQVNNPSNAQNGLEVTSNAVNEASALYVARTSPDGVGGAFDITHVNNTKPAVLGRTATLSNGSAGDFRVTSADETSVAIALRARHRFPAPGGLALLVEGPSRFSGNVQIGGTLTKPAGSFTIDHPLDPEHKTLSHSFVESPDMMNVYNGNAALDENGRATVKLPEYFEALNRDFRYQLTAIGAPGPNLYIAQGVVQNRFRIAGGRPYASVSWQVTGVRQDAYANEHRIKVEESKPAQSERGERDRLVVSR